MELAAQFRGFIQRLQGYSVDISATIDQEVNVCSNYPDAIATFLVPEVTTKISSLGNSILIKKEVLVSDDEEVEEV